MAVVLLVDTDRRFLNRVSRHLQAAGHDVIVAHSANEAREKLQQQRPDVIVMEIMLDYVMAGWDLAADIAKDPNLKDLPIIVTTALTSVYLSDHRFSPDVATVDAWLEKNSSPAEILGQVERLLSKQAEKVA